MGDHRPGTSPMQIALQLLIWSISIGIFCFVYPQMGEGDALLVLSWIVPLCAYRWCAPALWCRVFDLFTTSHTPEARTLVRTKFGSHINKFTLHLAFQLWGIHVLVNESWYKGIWDMDAAWAGWDPSLPLLTDGMFRSFYLAQLATFCSSMIMQYFEVRSHDHTAMLAHHAIAATLCISSYLTHCTHGGIFVLVTREIADVMIHMIRALAILEYKFLSEMLLVTLMIVWAISRNYYHVFVIWKGTFDSNEVYAWNYNMWIIYNCLLAMLAPLDLYYLYLGTAAILKRVMNPSQKSIDPDIEPATSSKDKKE